MVQISEFSGQISVVPWIAGKTRSPPRQARWGRGCRASSIDLRAQDFVFFVVLCFRREVSDADQHGSGSPARRLVGVVFAVTLEQPALAPPILHGCESPNFPSPRFLVSPTPNSPSPRLLIWRQIFRRVDEPLICMFRKVQHPKDASHLWSQGTPCGVRFCERSRATRPAALTSDVTFGVSMSEQTLADLQERWLDRVGDSVVSDGRGPHRVQ